MIYLIGGPPRSGKTTLAKAMSKKLRVPWISCDTLESVSSAYMNKEEWKKTHPYSILRDTRPGNDAFYGIYSSQKIVRVLRAQAKATWKAIDTMAICEITEGNDYIIEGYHIEPALVAKLIKKYGRENITALFLTKYDAQKFAKDVKKSTTPNDWLLVLTKHEETFEKVGNMVAYFSHWLEKEATKYGFKIVNMDHDFDKKIKDAIGVLDLKKT